VKVTHNEGNLKQTRELILVGDASVGVNERTLVGKAAVRSDQDVIGDRLTEDLNLQHISDDLLRLPVDVGVYQRDKVVAGDDVSEGGETLLDPLDCDAFGEGVAEVLEFLVGRSGGDEETVAVTCVARKGSGCSDGGGKKRKKRGRTGNQSSDNPGSTNARLNDGDDVSELCLEGRVEVGRAGGDGRKAVGVGEGGEDADLSV
jgi:hypothetical protein